MKQQRHDPHSELRPNRRAVLMGAASAAALGTTGALGTFSGLALAQNNLRSQISQIPGVGKGAPTDADWQKVGELCLGPTRASVKEGEFKGVELSFMGLNNQNLHNLLFRGFLKPWEAYTGAKISWIDLAQADYNPRLQQAIATGTVDFDILEMGAPFEGDVCGKGLASEMPDWVKKQIDIDDYVDYLKPPVGTWNGKTFRVTIDGDCHNFNYRTDYFSDAGLAKAWKDAGNQGEWGVPKTWQQVLAGIGSMIPWWGDIGQVAKASDTSVVGDVIGFDILPGSDDVYNSKTGKWDKLASGPNHAPNCAYLGWGVYVMARVAGDERKHKAAWSAAAHLGGKDLSLWTVMYPSGFQVHRTSHSNIDEWVAAGYDKKYITSYLNSQFGSYNHPNRAVEPRIPGIFQYYSVAEDELAKVFAGKLDAKTGADNIATAWERITDKIGRANQIALYKASFGA